MDKNKKVKTPKKGVIISICVVAVLVVGVCASGIFMKNYKQYMADKEFEKMLDVDNIYNNVHVDTISVGGLTKEQAKEKLNVELQQKRFGTRKITLQCANSNYTIDMTYDDAGMQYDIDTAVDEAYDYGRSGTIDERREIQEDLDAVGKFITIQFGYDDDKIRQFVENIAPDVEASVKEFTGGETVKVNVDSTVGMIKKLLDINEYDGVVYIAVDQQ